MNLEEFKIQVIPLKNKLYRFAKRFLANAEEAEDMVQEVFIKLWNRRDKLDEYRSVEAIAMVTTRNLCFDKLKRRKINEEKIKNLKDEMTESQLDQKTDLSDIIHKIYQIIQTLPEQQRSIIQLRDIEGYDFKEIAELLDMNENAVRVNLSRARKKIRESLTVSTIYEYYRN
jgi:RNA polymerase sigma-70 factor (ECF subfamily)